MTQEEVLKYYNIDLEALLDVYIGGKSLQEICKELEVTEYKLRMVTKALGLRMAKVYRPEDVKGVVKPKEVEDALSILLENTEEFNRLKRARKFMKKARKIHKGFYEYNLESYTFALTPMEIHCPTHGCFVQRPGNHLDGAGCPKCSLITQGLNRRKTTEGFIQAAVKKHKGLYDYSKVVYGVAKKPVEIICATHQSFWQTPNSHLNGSGCPKCGSQKAYKTSTGFIKYYDKPTILYYIKVTKGALTAFKIGLTTKSVKERFLSDVGVEIEVLKEKLYETGEPAWRAEQATLKKYKEFQYTGPPILRSGNSELFTKDIFSA